MDPLIILGLANALMQAVATLIDHARQQGATPEQLAQARADAVAHFDRVAQAVADAEPPPA